MEEGLIYDSGLMGEGSAMGEELCWVECQGFRALPNNDAKWEYLIDQWDGFPLSAVAEEQLSLGRLPPAAPATEKWGDVLKSARGMGGEAGADTKHS